MYGTKEDNDGLFPGYFGPNHSSSITRGPLKDDWGTTCPRDETVAWRNEHCKLLCVCFFSRALILCLTHCICPLIVGFSLQEAIYGTTLLKELELIKEKVDPDGMFTCAYCIGDN